MSAVATCSRRSRDGFERLWATPAITDLTLEEYLAGGESQTVEFKATARWNVHVGQPDKKMEHVIGKTVCGFLNAEGGRLFVGIDDDGQPLGLEPDFRTFPRSPNADGFELWLRQHLDANLSVLTAGTVKITFEQITDEQICVVTVAASGKPVFAKPLEGRSEPTEFWVRVGNATKQLHGDDMVMYQKEHWG